MKVVPSLAERPKTSLRKTSIQKYEIAQNCPFPPSLPLPFPAVIAFHRVKKSALITGIVDRINIKYRKQLFPFSESELSHTYCKLHVSTYFTSVSFIFAAIAQVWINLHRQGTQLSPMWLRKYQKEDEEKPWKGQSGSRRFSFYEYVTTFFYLFFIFATTLLYHFFLYLFTHDI